jgi:hypothetical protein
MERMAKSGKIRPSGFIPKRNQQVRAIDRKSGRDACDGPFIVTSNCGTGGAVKAIDQRNNHREFKQGVWRIQPVGVRKGGQ